MKTSRAEGCKPSRRRAGRPHPCARNMVRLRTGGTLTIALLMACSHSSKSIVSVQQSEKKNTAATQHVEVVTRQVTGPETITTTVREFALPAAAPREVMPSEPERQPERLRRPVADQHGLSVAQGVAGEPAHGPLIRETVTVDQRGPTSTSTSLNAQASTETHAEAAVKAEGQTTDKSRPSAGCAFGLGVWGLASLAGMVLALLAYLKGLLPWKP